ncbi:MAG: site-specific DNA-methyltransferase [Nanoarchaeota archaeon]|nr:site-specific DNA-methyltransferase [Nanoarchaeota archaeon]
MSFNKKDKYLLGDCKDVLNKIPDNTFDLIVTSPPYADSRKKTYGGIHPDKYVEWFLPRSKEFLRVLKPTGTFILNIKEKAMNGERHTYVIDLIKTLREQGWLWTEEFVWHKKNCHPGKWPNRFRDSWERCLQFNKSKKFNMYQDNVKVPVGSWAKSRLSNLSKKDKTRDTSSVGSGFGKNVANWLGRKMVYPDNVLHMATECGNKNHSATFPVSLPVWFIGLFTKEGDLVLDPFAGSGTTAVACSHLNRNYIMVDVVEKYKKEAEQRVHNEKIKHKRAVQVYSAEYSTISQKQAEKLGKHKSTLITPKEESIFV